MTRPRLLFLLFGFCIFLIVIAGIKQIWQVSAAQSAIATGSERLTRPLVTQIYKTAPLDAIKTWIKYSGQQLIYQQDAQGNQIPDYSYAGYEGGGVAIPDPTKLQPAVQVITVTKPGGADDYAAINSAITQAAALTLDANGFRAVVLLQAGTYHISQTIQITASGIVLRGSGDSSAGTIIAELPSAATGTTTNAIQVHGTGQLVLSGTQNITDTYVPVGANSVHVANATAFKVGDDVIIQRPQTASWIAAIGMSSIPPRKDGKPISQWQPGNGLSSEHKITSIIGNVITVDVPLTNALEQQYEQATISTYTYPGRISQVGIENLDVEGYFTATQPAAPEFMNMDVVENAWVQNVTIQHFANGYVLAGNSKWVTLLNVQALNMGDSVQHGAPATFAMAGQQSLIYNCATTGYYEHAFVTQANSAGPNVISHCTAGGDAVAAKDPAKSPHIDAAPHQRWSVGALFDDIEMDPAAGNATGAFEIINRGSSGTGQGWGGANDVLWNCRLVTLYITEPPTAHNWAVGCTGEIKPPIVAVDAQNHPLGTMGEVVDPGGLVSLPSSLYDEQLKERLSGLYSMPGQTA